MPRLVKAGPIAQMVMDAIRHDGVLDSYFVVYGKDCSAVAAGTVYIAQMEKAVRSRWLKDANT